jgi:diaminohydroxyphosphoribosylaminopyrimidine deaminase/5-amino-6-(5-phosphoribosylamino)uracil reductase
MLSPEELMSVALFEAPKGGMHVRPNPLVGCAMQLASSQVLSSFHEKYGALHAERRLLEELRAQGLSAQGARVAVTLEPCSHWGKTPPCAEALIEAKVAEVFVPFLDPNPLVAGKGVTQLKEAGIKVILGVAKQKAFELNKTWLWAHKLKRPYVTLKMATSQNSVWHPEENDSKRWITSDLARLDAMSLRAQVDLIVTSGATMRADNPAYTVRDTQGTLLGYQPEVVVLSREKNLALTPKLEQHPKGASVACWDHMREALGDLHKRGVHHVMVEAGPSLSETFFSASCVDEVWHYVSLEERKGLVKDLMKPINAEFMLMKEKVFDDQNLLRRYLKKDRSPDAFFAVL